MQVSTPLNFLLISDSPDDRGNQVIQEALKAIGSLEVASETKMFSHLQKQTYNLVIVVAGAITSASEIVSQVQKLNPYARIVVITASPHWKIAKAVIQAGAVDYLEKSLDKDSVLTSFRKILE